MLGSCASKAAEKTEESPVNDSTLIVYYSQTGATKAVAEELQKQLGCDIAAIEAVNPYDGDFGATIQRWQNELAGNVKVEIKPIAANLDDYNTIFLGFPIWGGTYASPIATFIADNSLAGKKVVTFSTFGSGGLYSATDNLVSAIPDAQIVAGYGVRNARLSHAPQEIARFLIEKGYIDGEVEILPAFSEYAPVTDNEINIFNQACGSYTFPLGTPVAFASRPINNGIEYKYDVLSKSPDGSEAKSTIYVVAINGTTPDFTQVIRN